MCRLVTHHANKPYKLDPQQGSCWLCQCGLSKSKPFCDGSHTSTKGEQASSLYFYADPGGKRVDLSEDRILHQSSLRNTADLSIAVRGDTQVIRLCHDSNLWSRVRQIRGEDGVQTLDSFDHYSDCYLLTRGGKGEATMRVTQARDGRIDCEDLYPTFLQEELLRPFIGSASRLIKSKYGDLNRREISWFIDQVWSDQYQDGMRIDLINATLPMVKYYERLGYLPIGDYFEHPRRKCQSQALIYFADAKWKSRLSRQLDPIFRLYKGSLSFDLDRAISKMYSHISADDYHQLQTIQQKLLPDEA